MRPTQSSMIKQHNYQANIEIESPTENQKIQGPSIATKKQFTPIREDLMEDDDDPNEFSRTNRGDFSKRTSEMLKTVEEEYKSLP